MFHTATPDSFLHLLACVKTSQAFIRVQARNLAKAFCFVMSLFALLFCLSDNGFAATCTATSGNRDWNTPSSWSCGQVPTSADDVIIPTGSTVTLDLDTTTIKSLAVTGIFNINGQNNRSRTLTVTGNVTINTAGSFTMSTPAGGSDDVHTLNIGGNFTNNGTFARLLSDDVINVVMNGTSAQTIGGTTATVFNNLTINNSTGVTLLNDITVAETLTLTTDLSTGNFTVTHTGPANACAGTGDLLGNVKRSGFSLATVYCFGNPNVTVEFASGTPPTMLTVSLTRGSLPGNTTGAVNRYYNIVPTGSSSYLSNLQLRYADNEIPNLPAPNTYGEGDLTIYQYVNNTWQSLGAAFRSSTLNVVRVTGVSTFASGAPWIIGGPSAPTAVRMKSAAAVPVAGGVRLNWSTGYEVDNLGFRVYREENGTRLPVTPSLVAGSALLLGARTELSAGLSYGWNDPQGTSQSVYWIEDIDLNGTSTWHGPISARKTTVSNSEEAGPVAKPFRNARLLAQLNIEADKTSADVPDFTHDVTPVARLNDFTLAAGQATVTRASRPGNDGSMPTRARLLSGERALKISVKQEGWYRIAQPALLAAGLNANSDPRGFRLYVGGQEIPCVVNGAEDGRFDATDAIEFYGLGLDTPATDTRVYWLLAERTNGTRIKKLPLVNTTSAGTSFRHTVERRDRSVYFASLLNGEAENFFGSLVTATAPLEQTLRVSGVDRTATEAATLEITLQGVTKLAHATRVSFNGTQLGFINFTNHQQGVQRFTVPANQINEGNNVVTLQSTAGSNDYSLVAHIRLTYNRVFRAENDTLTINAAAFRQVTIAGFTSKEIRVFDVTNEFNVCELTTQIQKTDATFSVTATPQGDGPRRLLALTNERAATIAGIKANAPSQWLRTTNAADLLIVTHNNVAAEFTPLAELRRSQGLRVAVVDIEDVYDELNDGNKSSNALGNFLTFAAKVWTGKPRYVLLAGDASYDPRNYTGRGNGDLVPSRLLDSGSFETASDDALVDFDGNALADLSIGRLPARTADEARRMVERLVSYEKATPSNETVLVSDLNKDFNFEAASEELRTLVPAGQQTTHIARAKLGDAAARTALLAALNRGPRVVNYAGHGSVNLWGSGSNDAYTFFKQEDALTLRNGNQASIYVMMTCLSGYFIEANADSVSEALLKSPNGGAVAVWAGSAFTPASGQALMNRSVFPTLFATGRLLGDVTREAKRATINADIRRTWILLGDPTMRLR